MASYRCRLLVVCLKTKTSCLRITHIILYVDLLTFQPLHRKKNNAGPRVSIKCAILLRHQTFFGKADNQAKIIFDSNLSYFNFGSFRYKLGWPKIENESEDIIYFVYNIDLILMAVNSQQFPGSSSENFKNKKTIMDNLILN